LSGLPGLSVVQYDSIDKNNYQYIVLELDPDQASLRRDELVAVLHAENILARKYFWPGCHRMEPYRSLQPNASLLLPETERIAARILLLPTGQAVDDGMVKEICGIIHSAFSRAEEVRSCLRDRR
jgi:dTDP-4-amino-4,6-dideoxygalactose transaminase